MLFIFRDIEVVAELRGLEVVRRYRRGQHLARSNSVD